MRSITYTVPPWGAVTSHGLALGISPPFADPPGVRLLPSDSVAGGRDAASGPPAERVLTREAVLPSMRVHEILRGQNRSVLPGRAPCQGSRLPWPHSTIRAMLLNERYIGKVLQHPKAVEMYLCRLLDLLDRDPVKGRSPATAPRSWLHQLGRGSCASCAPSPSPAPSTRPGPEQQNPGPFQDWGVRKS